MIVCVFCGLAIEHKLLIKLGIFGANRYKSDLEAYAYHLSLEHPKELEALKIKPVELNSEPEQTSLSF